MTDSPEKFTFSEGRQPVGVVVSEVVEATGLPQEQLLEAIPDLANDSLAALAHWKSDQLGDNPLGRARAALAAGWVVVRFTILNPAGEPQDMSNVMRSHAISASTGEIHSAKDFYEIDTWLYQRLGFDTQ